MSEIIIEKSINSMDIEAIKQIADSNRNELGFHPRQTFLESQAKKELLIAKERNEIIGFVRYHHRKDKITTLYEIASHKDFRGRDVGRKLIDTLKEECQKIGSRLIRLSCPVELQANGFYKKYGFIRSEDRSRPGKNRPLYIWELVVRPKRKIVFVASITATYTDIKNLIEIWEREAHKEKPFERCIITPLFIEAKSFELVKYIHDKWGVEVIFDSGGFFVQQEKIKYDELFSKLLNLYPKNDWAEGYVLPDFVPTSRQSEAEVNERVYVTAAEGIKFLNRLPTEFRHRVIGVLQGHTPEQLKHCLEAYMNNGLHRIGFGSFDTTGTNAEINILTNDAASRLEFVRRWIIAAFQKFKIENIPDLHLFGVSSPNIINEFNQYLATSFDSSGWMRTAGFGNVYLPFQGRKNVTHIGSALRNGEGLSAAQFYADCERTNHHCQFCKDFRRLQKDRFARMLHNAIVFGEMTDHINDLSGAS